MKNISEAFHLRETISLQSSVSVNNCEMTFAFLSLQNKKTSSLVVSIWFTCSHLNVMEKGEYRKKR